MAFPDGPIELAYEIYLNGDYVDVTNDIPEGSPVTISRGAQDEDAKPTASKCIFMLDNDTGDYSPPNPSSIYWESFDQNTPMRVTMPLAGDRYTRSVAGGLGSDDYGNPYVTPKGSGGTVQASDYAVDGSKATISVPVANGFRFAILAGPYRDVDYTAEVSLPFTNVTGGPVYPISILLRGVSDTDWVYAWVGITTAEAVQVGISHFDGTVIAAPVTLDIVHTSAQAIQLRAQAEGHTFRAKAWAVGTPEPLDWHASEHFDGNSAPGFVGIMNLVSSANTNAKPIVASYDNAVIRQPRFAGELSDIRVRWGESEHDVITHVTAQGLRRRLGQGTPPLLGPARRRINYILSTTVGQPYIRAWFPLEDPDDSPIEVAHGVSGVYMALPAGASPSDYGWMGDTTSPGAPGALVLSGGGQIYANVGPAAVGTSGWSVAFAAQTGPNKAGTVYMSAAGQLAGENFVLRLVIGADGVAYLLRTVTGVGGVEDIIISSTVRAGGWLANDWHHYIVSAAQSGGNVVFTLWVDGAQVGTQTTVGVTLRELHTVFPYCEPAYPGPLSISHLVVLTGAPASWHADTVDAISDASLGHRGELAGARMARICAEEDIPFEYLGDLADTPAMGPQLTAPFLAIFDQCVEVDRGWSFDPRGRIGFCYRTRNSAYTQTPVIVLDYSQGDVAPPIEPASDDQRLRNDVRVGRTGGAAPFRAQQLTGPKSVLPPGQGGVGRVETEHILNLFSDEQTAGIAYWLLSHGVNPAPRFPQIRIDVANGEFISRGQVLPAMMLDVGDLFHVINPFQKYSPNAIKQVCLGYIDAFRNFQHFIDINGIPEGAYRVAVVNAADHYVDSDYSTLSGGPYAPSDTSLTVSIAAPGNPWVTGAVSLDMIVDGEEVQVTNIAGAGPQTFTVVRAQNNVSKTLVAGKKIHLARPVYVGLGS